MENNDSMDQLVSSTRVPRDVLTMCQNLTIMENQREPNTTEDRSEIASPSQISSTFVNQNDQLVLLSTGSTDLSRFLETVSSTGAQPQTDRSEDCTTFTESLRTASEIQTLETTSLENDPQSTDKRSSGNVRKFVRSNSFTVETPSFKDLPSCDSLTDATIKQTTPSKNDTVVIDNDNRKPKWCFMAQTPPASANSSFSSPIVSDKVAERTAELVRKENVDDFDVVVIEEQVSRLKDMQIMLKEYHSLQMEHLKMRQRKEVETLAVQITCMEKILWRLKSKTFVSCASTAANDDKKSSIISHRSDHSFSFSSSPAKFIALNKTYPSTGRFGKLSASPPIRSVSKRLFVDGRIPEVLKKKLASFVKGYLLRRFMNVARVKKLVTTIKDVRLQLINLSKEKCLTATDFQFGEVLVLQLKTSLEEFHSLMFSTTLNERLNWIATDRQMKFRVKVFPTVLNNESTSKRLSSATIKRLSSKSSPFSTKSTSSEQAKTKRKRFVIPTKRYGSVVSPRKSPSPYFVNLKPASLLANAGKSYTFSCFSNNRKPWR